MFNVDLSRELRREKHRSQRVIQLETNSMLRTLSEVIYQKGAW
jgi:hypothetical protein